MPKAKNIVSFAALLLLLVGMPAVSYVYLKQGYDFRKEALTTQGDFGELPDLYDLPAVRGKLPNQQRGAMTVVGWLDAAEPVATQRYGVIMDSLFQQFAASPNLYFTILVRADDPAAVATEFAENYHLPDDEMISFLATPPETFRQLATDFQLPVAPGETPVVALVDSSLTIVKHYDLTSRDEAIGLVQLISLIIPLPEKPDLVLKREREL